jgi:hypothetical protein
MQDILLFISYVDLSVEFNPKVEPAQQRPGFPEPSEVLHDEA